MIKMAVKALTSLGFDAKLDDVHYKVCDTRDSEYDCPHTDANPPCSWQIAVKNTWYNLQLF